MWYQKIVRPILFLFPAEQAHQLTFKALKWLLKPDWLKNILKRTYHVQNESLKRKVFGISFPNPIGLAAGFDKDGKLFRELACFGFGFIEVGTVTPKAQPGNPKPRLFRLTKDSGLINRMGFNNQGVKSLVQQLKKRNQDLIIGGNIGKNKDTPNRLAVDDYLICFEHLHPWVDYFAINVSSPNTPNLRDLQEKEPLKKLLNEIQLVNSKKAKSKPILLKIAPDLSIQQLDDVIELIDVCKIDGVIATNTTTGRKGLNTDPKIIESIGAGGLSGKPLKTKSTEVIRYLKENAIKPFPVIAVGGIVTAEDAIEKLNAGADLVQVYTGFIYEGPGMVKKINHEIIRYNESNEN